MYRLLTKIPIFATINLLLTACPAFNNDDSDTKTKSGPARLIEIVGCADDCRIESGFIFGSAALPSKSDVFSVRTRIDGGPAITAIGSNSWRIKLPSATESKGFWYNGSKHQMEISTVDSKGTIVESRKFNFTKGLNKDFNGDGFPDLVVSAQYSDISGVTDGGAIYVYNGSKAGIQSSQYNNRLHYPATDISPAFGNTIPYIGDINGDGFGDLAVGAAFSDIAGIGRGAVFIYFGSAKGLSNGTGDASNSDGKNGKAYDQLLQYPGDDDDAYLGYFVASAGDVNNDGYDDLLATAAFADNITLNAVKTNQGVSFIYFGSAVGLSGGTGDQRNTDGRDGKKYDQRLKYPGTDLNARFGDSASGAGDVNGDGFSDIVIPAPFSDINGVNNGAAFIYFGSPKGVGGGTGDPANTDGSNGKKYDQRLLYSNKDVGSRFGDSFTSGMDINGDGFGDLVLSAYRSDFVGATVFESARGMAFVYFGSRQGLTKGTGDIDNSDGTNGKNYNQRLLYPESDDGAIFGYGITYGNINGDNYADVIIGASKSNFTVANSGIVYTYLGSESGLSAGTGDQPDTDGTNGRTYHSRIQYPGSDSDVRFGVIISAGTDYNLDGFSDLLISAYLSDLDGVDQGTVFMYYGGPSGISAGEDELSFDFRLRYPETDSSAVFGRFISW